MGPGPDMSFMFTLVPVLIGIGFVFVIGTIIFRSVKGVSEWSSNNRQPVLTVVAQLVSKRTHVSHGHHNHDNHMHTHSSTTYYATFQVESGDRMEFRISGNEYGLLAEGDTGRLTFQGTRYQGFARI